jgi:phage gp45-like
MLFQSCEAIGEEPFAPQRYHFTSGVEIGGDFVVDPLGGVQDHLGPLDLKIR